MDEFVCSNRSDVETVLTSSDWQPPPAPAALQGEVAELRNAMARFAGAAEHPERRSAIDSAVAALDGFPFADHAKTRAIHRLTGRRVDALADLGFIVPTETLASALDIAESELTSIRNDILEVVKAIGRQQAPTNATDVAVSRLKNRFSGHLFGHVPPISMLYQNHDATAALVAATVIAANDGTPRRSALARTARVATTEAEVGEVVVPAGTSAVVDLETTGFEFGTGPHHCPGQRIAEQIVAGITEAIASSDYQLIAKAVGYHPDGRPRALPMER